MGMEINQLLRLDSRSLMISDDVVFNERPILERAKRLKNQLTPHRLMIENKS